MSFFFQSPPQGTPGDLKKERKSGRGLFALRFDLGAEFPKEGGEFAGDGDFRFIVMKLALGTGAMAFVESLLGAPGELTNPLWDVGLPFGKGRADLGWIAVVGGALDEDPARMSIAALGDAALLALFGTSAFGRNESEIGHSLRNLSLIHI